MLIWLIVGPNLPDIKVRAESFDEALRKARLRNKNYVGGYVVGEE